MKKLLQSLLVSPGLFCMALLACLLTSCYDVTITSPHTATRITSLPTIQGYYISPSTTGVRLYLVRYSDGKYWTGTGWGDGGSAILPTTPPNLARTWQSTGTLPSGGDAATGLLDGYYNIIAIADISGGMSTRADSVVAVGVAPPPVTSHLYSWGMNTLGELGTGVIGDRNQPSPVLVPLVMEGKTIVAVEAGDSHTLALSSEGRVYSWGSNTSGQLGRGAANLGHSDIPTEVDMTGFLAGKRIVAIAAGYSHSLAVDSDGLVYGWGSNSHGELGNNNPSNSPVHSPVPVSLMNDGLQGKKVTAVSCGSHFSMALTSDGTNGKLFSWGENEDGQLGNGNNTDSPVPVAVLGLDDKTIRAVDCGDSYALALTIDGSDYKVYAFGSGQAGRLGTGNTDSSNIPLLVVATLPASSITSVSAGADGHSFARGATGRIYAWGEGSQGQIGNGGMTDQLIPVEIGGALTGKIVGKIEAGFGFSIATTGDGKVFAWGANAHGELAGATALTVPAPVPTEADFSAVLTGGRRTHVLSCGTNHAMILVGDPPLPMPEIAVEAQAVEVVSGGALDFGTQAMGVFTRNTVTIRNSGGSDLTNLKATIDGANFFTYLDHPALAPNDTMTFDVMFNPSAIGPHYATLHITSNDADESPFDIVLSGTGYPQGKPEPGFNAGVNGFVYTTALQPDGKILLGGTFTEIQPPGTPAPVARGSIARLNADGTLDASFHPNADGSVEAIAVQNDGKILISGGFNSLFPNETGDHFIRPYLARLNEDGTVDPKFNATGTLVDDYVTCIWPLPNGKIMIGGAFYTVDGTSRPKLARLEASGALDSSFNANVVGNQVYTLAVDQQGQIVMGGVFSSVGGVLRGGLARVSSTGALDTAFDPATGFGSFLALAFEKDGSLIVGGYFTSLGGEDIENLARIKTDNSIDTSFRPNPNSGVLGLTLQADGSMIVSGTFTELQPNGASTPTTRNRIARVYPSGTVDAFFDPDADDYVYGAAIQADGKIVISGLFSTVGGEPRIGTARLSSRSVTDVLTVTSPGLIEWQRGGGAPEAHEVSFDLSTDAGSTWSPLGAGTRNLAGTGWQKTGLSLPTAGRVRARARTASGYENGSSSLVETVTIFGVAPDIAVFKNGIVLNSNDTHQFGVVQTGSGTASVVFTIQNAGGGLLTGLYGVNISGAHASQYWLSGPTALPGGGSTITVTYKPKTSGPHYDLTNLIPPPTLNIPSNDPNEPVFHIRLNGTGGEPITTWKQRYFGETANIGDGADTADPDGDGITNLQEYAMGLDPTVAGGADLAISFGSGGGGSFAAGAFSEASDAPPTNGGSFFFNYTRNKLALADITFQVEWSDTLAAADWHTTGITEEILSDDDSIQQVQATVPAGTAGRRFAHLKITRP